MKALDLSRDFYFSYTYDLGASLQEQGRGAGEKATRVQGPRPGAIAFEEKNTAFYLAFCPVRVRGEEDIVQKFHRSLQPTIETRRNNQ